MSVQRTVLHVDDDPEFLELSERLFDRAATFETLTAPTAEDGLRLLETHEVDCIISDFVVSREGKPFISAARDVAVDVPIILFTGKEWDLVSNDALSANVTEYVQKAGIEEIEVVKSRAEEFVAVKAGSFDNITADRADASSDAAMSFALSPTTLDEEWELVAHHEWTSSEELGTTVLEAIEEYTGEDPAEFAPLFEAIDADALEELLSPSVSGTEREGVQVRFPYKGHELAVTSDGDIAIRSLQ
ncbi:HalOD1 output domain-containing protein [Halogranum rubrum]|nr:HalOD1 output domain-containing protein [Halogranum salarium]